MPSCGNHVPETETMELLKKASGVRNNLQHMVDEVPRRVGRPPKLNRSYTKGKANKYMEAMHDARKRNAPHFDYKGARYFRDTTGNGLVVYKKQ